MRTPIIVSLVLLFLGGGFSFWMHGQNLENKDFLALIISTVGTVGALISAVFLIYGYLVSLSAFKESQKPKILLQVHNRWITLDTSDQSVHETVIVYSNVSSNECKGLILHACIINDREVFNIPRLFSCPMNVPPNDSRTRDFPTKTYLSENGIDKSVIDNLDKYKLRVEYSFSTMGEVVDSFYDYTWDPAREKWNIA